MAAADWNTIASDLQRAVNNLAWFVLESMSIPEQPQVTASLPWPIIHAPPPPPPSKPPKEDVKGQTRKRINKSNLEPAGTKKRTIGEEVDHLIAETLV